MRILIAHSFYRLRGGEDVYVRQQLDLLRAHHDVELLEKHNRELRGGASTLARMLYSRRISTEIRRKIRRFQPDVIHLHNAYPSLGPAVFLVAKELRIPLVLTVHNYRLRCPNGYMFTAGSICTRCAEGAYQNAVIHPCFSTKSQSIAYASTLWTHRFVMRLEDTVSLFLCPSEFMRSTLRRWGIPDERVTLIRNYTAPTAEADSAPGEHGVYVGRLSREKGVHVLLEALRIAGDPRFVIVGDGPEAVQLHRTASRLGLRSTSFLGEMPAEGVDHVLQSARFVVLPSLWNENAPLVALEAMARGRPLLVSSVGGLPELAADGRGWVCQPGDILGPARQIDLLMRDDAMCRQAGDAALAFARDELTPSRHRVRLEQAYRSLVSATV
jgi:glycosyltransferase involved in cell wall biosynthesis